MRRLLFALLMVALLCANAFAAGTVTIVPEETYRNGALRTVIITWTADASDASVPSTAFPAAVMEWVGGLHCFLAEIDPGATAPTDNYDIVVTLNSGVDLFGGALADLDTAASERRWPVTDTATTIYSGSPLVGGSATFVLTNNGVNSATGRVRLVFSE